MCDSAPACKSQLSLQGPAQLARASSASFQALARQVVVDGCDGHQAANGQQCIRACSLPRGGPALQHNQAADGGIRKRRSGVSRAGVSDYPRARKQTAGLQPVPAPKASTSSHQSQTRLGKKYEKITVAVAPTSARRPCKHTCKQTCKYG